MISGKTQVIGVIGDPIQHSLSPLMHNDMLNEIGLDIVYVPFHVRKDEIEHLLPALRTLGIRGVNVTVPHKQACFKMADECTESAQLAQSVNTLFFQDGQWIGDSTDGKGFCLALKQDCNREVSGLDVTILGAGGAARSIAVAVLQAGCASLSIANRTLSTAQKLAQFLSTQFDSSIRTFSLTDPEFISHLSHQNLIVQTTSVGMNHPEMSPIDSFDWIHSDQIISDIIYSPLQTRLLSEASNRGAQVHTGLGMLAGQGILAFECFTRQPADYGRFKSVLEAHFG